MLDYYRCLKSEADMIFRAVGARCAVDMASLNLPIPRETAISILTREGFRFLKPNPKPIIEKITASAAYRRGARMSEAPNVFDCSSFVKWIYGAMGIWLPRRSIQQFTASSEISDGSLRDLDLVFAEGLRPYYTEGSGERIGHVGLIVSGAVAHAAGPERRIVVEPLIPDFLANMGCVYTQRFIPDIGNLLTLVAPLKWEVETSDDIRWIILQKLP